MFVNANVSKSVRTIVLGVNEIVDGVWMLSTSRVAAPHGNINLFIIFLSVVCSTDNVSGGPMILHVK
jgi:hypothetical protein